MAQSTFAASAHAVHRRHRPGLRPAGVWNLGVEYPRRTKAVRPPLSRPGSTSSATPHPDARSRRRRDHGSRAGARNDHRRRPEGLGREGRAHHARRLGLPTANWKRYKTGAQLDNGRRRCRDPTRSPRLHLAIRRRRAVVISGLAPFVTDAIANRGGLVLLRLKADDEQPAQSQWCAYDAVLVSSSRATPARHVHRRRTPPIDPPNRRSHRRGDRVCRPALPAPATRPRLPIPPRPASP